MKTSIINGSEVSRLSVAIQKSLVDFLDENKLDKKFLGFSNQRMAYHDLFIKLCYMLEKNSLIASYTDKQLNDRAREDEPFDEAIIETVKCAILVLSESKRILEKNNEEIHITKATLISWLYFFANAVRSDKDLKDSLVHYFVDFEINRFKFKAHGPQHPLLKINNSEHTTQLLEEFNFRAVSRVMTGSSLLIRDYIISLFYIKKYPYHSSMFDLMKRVNVEAGIEALLNGSNSSVLEIMNCYSDSCLAGVTICQ